MSLQVKGFEEYMERLDKVGGSEAMRRGVEAALRASKNYVTPEIQNNLVKNKLPAKGRYSHGGTLESIDIEPTVNWSGMTASINVGFDFKKSGLKSIFLMYGTPRMKPVNGLKNAIYGTKAQKRIAEIQAEALNDVVREIMEGN